MSPQDIESSLNEIIDNAGEDPTIEMLKGLLKTIEKNRCAIEAERVLMGLMGEKGDKIKQCAMDILKAFERGDRAQASDAAIKAQMAGIHSGVLKAVCRLLKNTPG